MQNRTIKKSLVVGIIFLFIGVGIQPAFAVEPVITSYVNKEENTNPKEYLFQTIVDFANNPDVKDLLEQYENDLLSVNIDRSVYREIFVRNPRLLFNMLFTKPSMTTDYLNHIYDRGVEITRIVGEKRTVEILDSTRNTNPEFYEELDKIITNDEELSYRINSLKEMNKELKPDSPSQDFTPICAILFLIFGGGVFWVNFLDYFMQKSDILYLLLYPLFIISQINGRAGNIEQKRSRKEIFL